MSALNARALTVSPSRMSIALRVPPPKPALNSRDGSGRLAPFMNVSFTTCLYSLPVQTIPSCDQTGTPVGLEGFFPLSFLDHGGIGLEDECAHAGQGHVAPVSMNVAGGGSFLGGHGHAPTRGALRRLLRYGSANK